MSTVHYDPRGYFWKNRQAFPLEALAHPESALSDNPPNFFLATLHGLQHISSQTRDRTWATAVKALSPNHWTSRELPISPQI